MSDKGSTASAPVVDPATLIPRFYDDLKAAYDKILNKDSSGKFAVIVLAFLLTVWVWFKQGAAAGAPLAASFFICLAFFV